MLCSFLFGLSRKFLSKFNLDSSCWPLQITVFYNLMIAYLTCSQNDRRHLLSCAGANVSVLFLASLQNLHWSICKAHYIILSKLECICQVQNTLLLENLEFRKSCSLSLDKFRKVVQYFLLSWKELQILEISYCSKQSADRHLFGHRTNENRGSSTSFSVRSLLHNLSLILSLIEAHRYICPCQLCFYRKS